MTLDGIINPIKNFGRAAVLAGAMLVSGCIGIENNYTLGKSEGNVYTDVRLRGGISAHGAPEMNAGERMHYIPIHPADGGAVRGGVETEFSGGSYALLSGGIDTSIGTENTRLRGGIDFRLCNGETDVRARQPLPLPYNSQAWTREEISSPYSPFIGFSQAISRNCEIGFDVGFPYAEVEASAGHHRYNHEETIMRGEWKGFGISYALHFYYKGYKRWGSHEETVGFSIIYEKFEPEFGDVDGGEIESFSVVLRVPLDM